MNLQKILTISLMLTLPTATLWADNIPEGKAVEMARNFLRRNTKLRAVAANMPIRLTVQSEGYYAYNIGTNSGYVLIATDDNVQNPILGYSTSGTFDAATMPDNLRWWLSEYDQQVEAASRLTKEQLQSMRLKLPRKVQERTAIEPLLTTKWDQSAPYNEQTPMLGDMQTYVGCVATAVAQIMRFHKWPETGSGYHEYQWNGITLSRDFTQSTYDWDNMTDTYDENSTQESKDAVANLMADVGIAVNMEYTEQGSGAFTQDVAIALRDYFGYGTGTSYIIRQYYSKDEWENIIYQELANRRPVYYAGSNDNAGHAFVCDGYSTDGYYHFNWGWSGHADGYFQLSLLDPDFNGIGSSSGGYSCLQEALIGVQKDATEKVIDVCLNNAHTITPEHEALSRSEHITVNGTYHMYCLYSEDLCFGVKTVSETGEVKYIRGDFKPQTPYDLIPDSGKVFSYNVPLCELPTQDGTYKIIPAVYNANTDKWIDMRKTNRIEYYDYYAKVEGDKTDILKESTELAKIEMEHMTLVDNTFITSNNLTCKSKVKSVGGEYTGNIYTVILKRTEDTEGTEDLEDSEDEESYETVTYSCNFCDIKDGESVMVTANVPTPDEPGKYYFAQFYEIDENMSSFSDMIPIEVIQGCTDGTLSLAEESWQIEKEPVAGQKYTINATLSCTEGNYYGYIYVHYFDSQTSYYLGQAAKEIVSINDGETKTVTLHCTAPEEAKDVIIALYDANNQNIKVQIVTINDLTESSITAKVGSDGYATMVADYNFVASDDNNVNLYGIIIKNGKAELIDIAPGTIIPQETSILIKATEGTYQFDTTTQCDENLFSNQLHTALTDITADGSQYVLANEYGTVGFAKVNIGETIPQGKTYLKVGANDTTERFYAIGDVATDISNATDGNLKDTNSDIFFTPEGIMTKNPIKGLYIRKDGKKFEAK